MHKMGMVGILLATLAPGWTLVTRVHPTSKPSQDEQPPVAEAPEGWKLVWNDEFDGQKIDPEKWDFDLGNGFYDYDAQQWIPGWGNDEKQFYTRNPRNAFVRDGQLHIRAVKESYMRCGYTSARLKTRNRDGSPLFQKTYGRFEFRAKLPTGQGIWPALWLMPQDEKYGSWASSGEIDILEARGQEPTKVVGALHYGGRWPANTSKDHEYTLPNQGSITDFHVYALEWLPGEMRWSVDGKVVATKNFWWSTSKMTGNQGAQPVNAEDLNPWPAPFNQPFYLLMNVAVGGKFPGLPARDTHFPVEMIVDYVRVYDKIDGYGPVKLRGDGKLPFDRK